MPWGGRGFCSPEVCSVGFYELELKWTPPMVAVGLRPFRLSSVPREEAARMDRLQAVLAVRRENGIKRHALPHFSFDSETSQ